MREMTLQQKQCLLMYLGYYDGPVDGIWGEKSRQATMDFQHSAGLIPDGIFGTKTEKAILKAIVADPWADVRYFTQAEFACKCGIYCSGHPAQMDLQVVKIADRARAHFGAPAEVVSGLRCEIHNRNVGGVANSRHMRGKAIDLRIRGVNAAQLLDYLESEPEVRYAYAINDTNVHLDVE
jgi:peptidoglycan hydrolase-like protein with peptidoglycan-binding domain